MARRDQAGVGCSPAAANDWTARYPSIRDAVAALEGRGQAAEYSRYQFSMCILPR
jgi:hypothetical protein